MPGVVFWVAAVMLVPLYAFTIAAWSMFVFDRSDPEGMRKARPGALILTGFALWTCFGLLVGGKVPVNQGLILIATGLLAGVVLSWIFYRRNRAGQA